MDHEKEQDQMQISTTGQQKIHFPCQVLPGLKRDCLWRAKKCKTKQNNNNLTFED